MRTVAPLRLQWVRHGKIESHRGDVPITAEGIRQAETFGRRLHEELVPGEIVSFLYAPTRRARETATVIYDSVAATLDDAIDQHYRLQPPIKHWAIRNPDIYVAGTRIDLVSSAEALAEQLPPD